MYKLLMVTDRAELRSAYPEQADWMALGFKAPRTAGSAEEAMRMLRQRHTDAIAFDLPPQEEAALEAFLAAEYPLLPIVETGRTREEQTGNLKELGYLLDRMHMDVSDDRSDRTDMLQLMRHDFFRKLLGGGIRTEQEVLRQMKLLRSKMNPLTSCVVVDLTLPPEDDYMTTRWHYGNERMETALRNFFGADHDGLHILISVLPDNQIRMLCCPLKGADVAADSITARVAAHTEACMEDVRRYLGMNLQVAGITVIPSLTSLAKQA